MRGSPPSSWKGLLMNTQQNCDQESPSPPFPCRRDSRYIYITDLLFSANPSYDPPPPIFLEKMFIAYFWHWWLKNWLRTVQHPMKWYYWIIKQKIIIIIKWVRWPAVLSCDWWLDSVAVVTSAVWEVEGGVEKAQKKRKLEKPRHGTTPPPSQGLGNITSSTILSCTVICSRQSPRLYCTVLCRAQYSSVLYSAVSKL